MINKLQKWFLNTRFWRWFAMYVMAHLKFRVWGYPKLDITFYENILDILDTHPESIFAFVGVDKYALSYKINRLVTGAKWSHAGIITHHNMKYPKILHMLGDGVHHDHLLTYLKEVDEFALIRLPIDSRDIWEVQDRINNIIKYRDSIDYDYPLEIENETINLVESEIFDPSKRYGIYCSELVFLVGRGIVKDLDFVEKWIYGKRVFEPDDVFNAGEVLFWAKDSKEVLE